VVLLVAVAVIVATGLCLAHLDDGSAPDVCASLLAVTFGVTLLLSLSRTPSMVVIRPDGYRPFFFEPPVPPPKA
jgi:hypothetical protein